MNAALAMIEAFAPRDEIEGALAVQMARVHSAAMVALSSLGAGGGSDRRGARIGGGATIEGLRDAGSGSPSPATWRWAIRAGRACSYS